MSLTSKHVISHATSQSYLHTVASDRIKYGCRVSSVPNKLINLSRIPSQKISKFGTHVALANPPKRRVVVYSMQADDLPPSEMSHETALKLLGVRDDATFDEILRAKNAIIDKCNGDQERLVMVEAAYDILLMQSLSKRRAGKVVDSSVRFADVKFAKTKSLSSSPSSPSLTAPLWLSKLTKSSPIDIARPSSKNITTQASVYGALALWTAVSAISNNEDVFSSSSASSSYIPGLQLALAFAASLYFLRQENVKLGKASLITTCGLITGAIIGTVFENWLRVDIFPIFGISSPATLVSEFVYITLLSTSLFLR